jgi:p-hydroxybenzoate 3-monooxygenase
VRTRVGVVGAGPAGLVLANLLVRAGIETVVVERQPREHVEQRARAGLLEHRTVHWLHERGLADRLVREGTRHGVCEFRLLDQRVRVDYAALSGGSRHWVYPQQFLVRDLIAELEHAGCAPLFETAARAVVGAAGDRPRIVCDGLDLDCDYVVGCDGFQGIARAAFPAALGTTVGHRYPYDWLTVLAEVDRPAEAVVYGLHAEGFAGMMPRTPTVSRFYLQCPPGDTPDRWPAVRVVEQLRDRLTVGDATLPRLGDILATQVLAMRCAVSEPLRHGRLFLAGDAAHVLTPSGAKGANLAIADAGALAEALIACCLEGDAHGLDTYTEHRLREIWRTQEFSDRLLRLLHLPAGEEPGFALRMRLGAISRLTEPGPHAAAFAHQYAGSVGHV